MAVKYDFPLVFEQLKNILKPYAGPLTVKADTPDTYYLDGPYSESGKRNCSSARRRSRRIMFRSISCLFTCIPNF